MTPSASISYFEIEKNIEIAVNDGRQITVITYSVNNDIEQQLDTIIATILERHGDPELKGPIYTCIKELAINGTKANQKRVFFEEIGLDMLDPSAYAEGMRLYKQSLSERKALEYGVRARDKGLFVKISFDYDEAGMRIRVMNNTPINPAEERRLRDKLARVMQYESIVEFYMEQGDETEGAGMGIALIIILLKGAGINPHYFRLGLSNDITTALIEIPFNEGFVSIREQYLADKKG